MRKLMCCAIGYCSALALGHYLLPNESLPCLALACILPFITAFFLRGNAKTAVLLLSLSASVGFLWHWGHNAFIIAPAEKLIGQCLEVNARVLEYPNVNDEYSSLDLRLCEDWAPGAKVRVYSYDEDLSRLRPGDEVRMELEFISARKMSNTESDYYFSDGIFLRAQVTREYEATGVWNLAFLYAPKYAAHSLKALILDLFPGDTAPLIKALLTGDKREYYKDDSIYMAMKTSGLSHIIAVSGMHISFILGLLQLWTGKRRFGAFLGIVLIWFFAAMTGFTPSVVRAAAMTTLMLIAPILRRENDGPTALSAAALLLTLPNPQVIASISFQLSFAAMAGIIALTPRIHSAISRCFSEYSGIFARPLRVLSAAFASSVGAIAFTTPLVALHFGFVPLYGIAANMLCLWAMSTAFMTAFPVCIIAAVYFPLGKILACLIAWLPRYTVLIAKAVAGLPFAALPAHNNFIAWWLVLVYALLFLPLLRRNKPYRPVIPICCCVISFLAVSIIIPLSSYKGFEFTALDVGQGQCLVLSRDDATVVIDCGSNGSPDNAGDIAADHLLSRGRNNVDLLILTHLHADHANGVVRLMNSVNVRRILLPEDCEDTEFRDSIMNLCYDKGTEIYIIEKDSQINLGGIQFEIYVPLGSENPNENGLFVLGESDDFRFLVTGDAGDGTEKLFLSIYGSRDIDLLVAGHHGSKYSSCEQLLDAATPESVLISVGINSYGHPAPELLERLNSRGINIFRTDLQGNITIRNGS